MTGRVTAKGDSRLGRPLAGRSSISWSVTAMADSLILYVILGTEEGDHQDDHDEDCARDLVHHSRLVT